MEKLIQARTNISFLEFERQNFLYNKYLIDLLIPWWSKEIAKQKFLLKKTVEEIKATCIYAIISFYNDEPIAAAGVFSFKPPFKWENKTLVELGSCLVNDNYRNEGIASDYVEKRLNFVKRNNYFPFCVTAMENHAMDKANYHHVITIDEAGSEFQGLGELIGRDCRCPKNVLRPCDHCPGENKAIKLYKSFI